MPSAIFLPSGKNIIVETFTEFTWKKERLKDVLYNLYIWPAAERHWHIHQRIHARLLNAPGKIPFRQSTMPWTSLKEHGRSCSKFPPLPIHSHSQNPTRNNLVDQWRWRYNVRASFSQWNKSLFRVVFSRDDDWPIFHCHDFGRKAIHHSRWAPTSYKSSLSPLWPYKLVTGGKNPISGVRTILMIGRGPSCTVMLWFVTWCFFPTKH